MTKWRLTLSSTLLGSLALKEIKEVGLEETGCFLGRVHPQARKSRVGWKAGGDFEGENSRFPCSLTNNIIQRIPPLLHHLLLKIFYILEQF